MILKIKIILLLTIN